MQKKAPWLFPGHSLQALLGSQFIFFPSDLAALGDEKLFKSYGKIPPAAEEELWLAASSLDSWEEETYFALQGGLIF